TAVIDPTNWQLIVVAPGVAPGTKGLLMDNHYRDQFGRLWSESQATENGSALAGVYITNPKTFRNEKTISLGQNVLNTVGLTPDGKFAVVPVSTTNQLNVYDTGSYGRVATIGVGSFPNDMMVSADGKYCCEPDRDSDWLTIVDTKTWKVMGKVPTGDGSASPTPAGYITPDPNGKHVYASIETGLQVIDTSSLQVVNTISTGGVVGTPYVLT
ncbi:MAG: YncE family protein, partial [Nitrososphaerales archaeon]